MKKAYSLISAAGAVLFMSACNNLDVSNPNQPDVARALSSPGDVQSLAQSTVRSWYMTSVSAGPDDNGDLTPYHFGSVTSDVTTGNFGNFGMRFNNLEPRIPYGNSSAGGDRAVTETPWNYNYGTIGATNDVLRALKNGLSLGSADITEQYKQEAQFSQAASFTYLAMQFDQAFVVTEDNDPASPPSLVPYAAVRDSALRMWNTLIAASAGKNYTYALTDLPLKDGALTSGRINRIANTMAAMLLAYSPRIPAQSASVDWAAVAAYADKGIGTGSAGAPFDIVVVTDRNTWWSYVAAYGDQQDWIRMDHRVINRMNPAVPPRFGFNASGASDPTIPPQGTSADARYTTDFGYRSPPIGDPARGIYMQSVFYHKRYEFTAESQPGGYTGPVPYMLAAESDLIHAEALIRSGGNPVTAAQLINNTRVGRGNLPPATGAEGTAALLSMISYERDVELVNTSGTTLYWRRAITDQPMQAGTVCQLPIPAKELETLALPIYTFGGVGGNPCS
ncbi:MAG TPA: RagB/SusD family nutrient uptake outer membrane protein [Gemmatimonadaceae bacterium]